MDDVADRYRRLAEAFTQAVAAVPDDRWHDPTPCEGWDALALVDHVVGTQHQFRAMVGAPPVEGHEVADDPLAAWGAARDAVQADLDDPDRARAPFDGLRGPTTFAELVDRFLGFDLVVHRWDLARATGQDERIDPTELPRLWEDVAWYGDDLRRGGVCGPALDAPDGADDQTRLLAHLGRRS